MLYLLLAVASSALVSIFMRLSETKIKNNIGMLCVNYFMCLVLAWSYTGFAQPFPEMEKLGLAGVLGILNGFLYFAGFFLLQWSIRKNGVVLSSTFMKLGLLVSILVSILFFREMPNGMQVVGFALAVAAIILINYQKQSGSAGFKASLLLLLVTGGVTDSLAKVYEQFGNPALSEHFLLYTFAAALFFCVAVTAYQKQGFPGRAEIFYGLLVGIPNFFSAKFLLRSLVDISAVIVYPVCSVGTILVVTLAGVLLFRERLERRQWLALALILVALVLLNI